MLINLKQYLFKPVDGASLATFRIMFGVIVMYHYVTFYFKGKLQAIYLDSIQNIPYPAFSFLTSPPDFYLIALVVISFVLSLFFALGLFFRYVGFLLFIIESYFFLLEQSYYLNHIYFVSILALLLTVTPAHKLWSLDAHRNRKNHRWEENDFVPQWSIVLLAIQMEIVLVYAGLVKLTPEFFEGHSLRIWFSNTWPFHYEWVVRFATYAATSLHILGAPLLLWRKTRTYAFAAYTSFHLTNHLMFGGIGIFPIMTLAATTIFFSKSWPRKALKFLNRLLCLLKIKLKLIGKTVLTAQGRDDYRTPPRFTSNVLIIFLFIWISVQALVPLRHFLYDDNVHWTRNGYFFSWQMMLVSKRIDRKHSGYYICADDNLKRTACWKANYKDYLSKRQHRKSYTYPNIAMQYAHIIEKELKAKYGYNDVRVYAVIKRSISGRPFQNSWDPDLDLTLIKDPYWNYKFFLPLIYNRPNVPPLNSYIEGRLRSHHGYWQKNPNEDVYNEDNDYHQKYPLEYKRYKDIEKKIEARQ